MQIKDNTNMNLSITSNFNKKCWFDWLILLPFSFSLGLYLFFSNPWLRADLQADSYSWFLDFSRTIFQPQSAYYAESILLPLLARLIGATNSLENYKLLCAFLTLCILPIVAIFAQNHFHKLWKTLLFIFLFGLSFQYLQYYILGFPDPLTILLLVLAVFQRKLIFLFLLLMMATSITILAILVGKMLLLSWYAVFHYQLMGRMDWALSKGYSFFLERYEANVFGFWLTPGVFFLGVYLLCVIFFIPRNFRFAMAAIFSLVIAYLALFWTIDGLRVFAVIIAAPYAYLLVAFISSIRTQSTPVKVNDD